MRKLIVKTRNPMHTPQGRSLFACVFCGLLRSGEG